jgi:Helix-hairpin-helix motif
MSTGTSSQDPAQKLRSVWWRISHSAWMLPSILCIGILTGASFLYIGVRARRKAWWIPGIVYLVVGLGCFVAFGVAEDDSFQADLTIGGLIAIWLGGITHAILINREWLRWYAYYGSPWYRQTPIAGYPFAPPGGYAAPPGYPPQASALQHGAPQYYSHGPVAQPAPAQPAPAPAPSAPVGPLDVNLATPEQFASLPGFDAARAQWTIAERNMRRAFGSVEEFAAAAQLAPHEFAQLRGMVVCPPHQWPNDQTPPTSGRVVDV